MVLAGTYGKTVERQRYRCHLADGTAPHEFTPDTPRMIAGVGQTAGGTRRRHPPALRSDVREQSATLAEEPQSEHSALVSLAVYDPLRRTASTGYALLVMVLMASAMADPNHPRNGLFIASLVLCLPTMLPALPVFYVVLATVWNLSGGGDGGPTWPVTAAYIIAIGMVAMINMSIVKLVIRQHGQHA